MKLAKYVLILCMALCVVSCKKTSVNLLDKIIEYQEKLDTIIAVDESTSMSMQQRSLQIPSEKQSISEELDPDKLIKREAFLAVYNQQVSNALDVQLDEFLMIYQDLLDETIAKLEEQEIIAVIAYLTIDFGEDQGLDAVVTMSPDQGIVIKMTLSFDEINLYYGVKLGYEGADFYIRELSKNDDSGFFEYFEFLENHYVVNARYSGADYWFHYVNQVDSTYYSISEQNGSFTLSWYNPETMVRTILSDEGNLKNYELFNEKGILFSYSDFPDTGNIYVAWQLLEATGWDAAYMQDGNGSIHTGVYWEGLKLPIEARQYNVDLNVNFANVRLDIEMPKDNFTDEVLNLSAYGLDFQHPDLTVALIQSKIDSALEESAYLSVYRGVDFLNDDLSVALYAVVDEDVKPN